MDNPKADPFGESPPAREVAFEATMYTEALSKADGRGG